MHSVENLLTYLANTKGLSSEGKIDEWVKRYARESLIISTLDTVALSADAEEPVIGEAEHESSQAYADTYISLSGFSADKLVKKVDDALANIERHSHLNAFIHTFKNEAPALAKEISDAANNGQVRPLVGMTFVIKDIIETAGHSTTSGTHAVSNPVSTEDAPCVTRLKESGAIPLAMTNLHALAFGALSTSSSFGEVQNPIAPGRFAGGSSGGSAAAVAAGIADVAIGTDTGGSVRIPSSLCGLYGIKPTRSKIPTKGVKALSETLDHVGPLAGTLDNLLLAYSVMSGHQISRNSLDEFSLEGVTIGVPSSWFSGLLDGEVKQAWHELKIAAESKGALIREISIPMLKHAGAMQLVTITADAFDTHGYLLKTAAESLPPDVRVRLEMGMFRNATDYARAQRARRQLTHEFISALSECDVMLWPTLPVVSPEISARTVMIAGNETDIQSAFTCLTIPYNLTGLPVMNIPWRRAESGSGIGMQIGAGFHKEEIIFKVANALMS